MLDLLGRSQELDDERAIELLQQSKQIAEAAETSKGDLRAVRSLIYREGTLF